MVRATDVAPLDGFRLRLTFDDASVREVDLARDVWGPMAEPLRDEAYVGPRQSVARAIRTARASMPRWAGGR